VKSYVNVLKSKLAEVLWNLQLEMGIVYFEGCAHLLHLRPFGIMSGSVLIKAKIAMCTWEQTGV
jgi:hypothetical protein